MFFCDVKITFVTKNLPSIVIMAALMVFVLGTAYSFSGDVATVCSDKYLERLEKKHENLVGAGEDLASLNKFLQSKAHRHAAQPAVTTRQMVVDDKISVRTNPIVPNSSRIALEAVPLRGPLSPGTSLGTVKDALQQTVGEKETK